MVVLASILCFLSFCALAVLLFVWVSCRRKLRRVHIRMNKMASRLEELENRPEPALFEDRGKDSDLLKRRISERFENVRERRADVSGKYRHVDRLERSGLGAEDIAEILEVSRDEAEQMLLLARFSRA